MFNKLKGSNSRKNPENEFLLDVATYDALKSKEKKLKKEIEAKRSRIINHLTDNIPKNSDGSYSREVELPDGKSMEVLYAPRYSPKIVTGAVPLLKEWGANKAVKTVEQTDMTLIEEAYLRGDIDDEQISTLVENKKTMALTYKRL